MSPKNATAAKATKTEKVATPADQFAELNKANEELHRDTGELFGRVADLEEEVGIVVEPPEGFFRKTAHHSANVITTKVRLYDVLAVGGSVAAWRGAAHLLESRIALPVGLWADIVAGAVGVSVVRTTLYFVHR